MSQNIERLARTFYDSALAWGKVEMGITEYAPQMSPIALQHTVGGTPQETYCASFKVTLNTPWLQRSEEYTVLIIRSEVV